MIRRDPNYRPPPAWPPNPAEPAEAAAPTAATATDPPRSRPTASRIAVAPPTTAAAAPHPSPSAACVAIVLALFLVLVLAVAGHGRHRVLDRHQAAPDPGAGRLPRPPRRRARAPHGCWSARTAGRDSPPNSRPNWPPAATSATGTPTRSCSCTFPRCGQTPRPRWCRFPVTRTWRSPTTAATRSTPRSPSAGPRCWRRPWSRRRECGSTTTPRSNSTGSQGLSTPSAG